MAVRENVPTDDAVRARLNRPVPKAESDQQKVAALRQIRPSRIPEAPRDPGPELPAKVAPDPEKQQVAAVVDRVQDNLRRLPIGGLGWPAISALLCIALPTFLAGLYYVVFAADIYVSEARFAVRTNEPQQADVLGMMTGMPSGSVVLDSYIVSEFIESREMVSELERRLPLRAIFSDPRADALKRLDPTVQLERLVAYWNQRVDVYFDPIKSTISVQVQAFTAEDAEKVVREVVNIAKGLVNDLSVQARRDAVEFAAAELARAELRVRAARQDLVNFRATNRNFDPSQTASAAVGIAGRLESERSQLNSQLAAVSSYLGESAPSVQMLKSRIRALEGEIGRVQGEISQGTADGSKGVVATPDIGTLANVVAAYEEVLLDQEFAEKSYTAALGSVERARAEADREQSYLAVYMHPNVAQQASYPERVKNIFLVFLLCSILWSLGSLGFLTARDHIT